MQSSVSSNPANFSDPRDHLRGSSSGSTSISNNDLEQLPYFEFKAVGMGSSHGDCAVCLDNFKMGDKCRLLPICLHSFHAQCVDSWLLKKPICPICRTVVNSQMGSMALGKESSHSSDIGIELRESQPVTSSPRLNASALEPAV
ncbi:hypothetical protein HHK36_029642 [Tetracentron sinense]|uniref:RING-type domain-containing protein n=1 Tax=Tetracentron sinense TaxID=13715 RepID=A0A834YB99_TETSI|nr:hypothetical protein HHK36_029642 [Tetracentron sinense]